jgi:hypothetical protein
MRTLIIHNGKRTKRETQRKRSSFRLEMRQDSGMGAALTLAVEHIYLPEACLT